MKFPKLSPLQSRFAASLGATLLLLLVYLTLTQPHFAYAVELDTRIPPDHNHPIIFDEDFDFLEEEDGDGAVPDLELDKRQAANFLYLRNNQPQNKDINPGQVQNWVFTEQEINGPAGERGRGLPSDNVESSAEPIAKPELKKRQSMKQVYITMNTCLQPLSTSTSNNSTDLVPPQLLIYVSQSQSNQNPGPSSSGEQVSVSLDAGYILVNLTTESDVYFGVATVNSTGFTGSWNYEIAASIDAPYHSYNSTPLLHFVDADDHAALLITDNLTQANPNQTVYQEWMSMAPPYGMFGQDQNDPAIMGVAKSYCGLMHNARVVANLQDVQNQNTASMTSRGLGAKPKEQFYITSLNASSSYYGFLAMQGNSTDSGLNVVGGGGKVWAAVNFSTKAVSNCALMYNLSFCSEVAYAVPTNPDLFSPRGGMPALASLYDNNTQSIYQNFSYSLQQIPCNITASAQYSLARNCDDCARAYKAWLCAVTIPRCEDFQNPASYLKVRNAGQKFPNGTVLNPNLTPPEFFTSVSSNQSRNPLIDTEIQPGPYKEVLPCIDLCHDLVQSCPAALGFGCPRPGPMFGQSYGTKYSNGSEITCSYLGAAYYLSAGPRNGIDAVVSFVGVLGAVLALAMAV